jgi:hypothetical protein
LCSPTADITNPNYNKWKAGKKKEQRDDASMTTTCAMYREVQGEAPLDMLC